jgi:hypothetical protein
MVAPRGEGTGGCARGRWATSIKRKPAVNIASPVLRTRCCGGFLSDRGENRDPGLATMKVKKIIDKGGAIREQAHQQLKEELGLDHFEGRSWTGLHRHALMTMIAYAFLQSRRLKAAGRKKKSRRTAAATEHAGNHASDPQPLRTPPTTPMSSL